MGQLIHSGRSPSAASTSCIRVMKLRLPLLFALAVIAGAVINDRPIDTDYVLPPFMVGGTGGGAELKWSRYYCEGHNCYRLVSHTFPHIRGIRVLPVLYVPTAPAAFITDARMIACAQLHPGHFREPCLLEHVSQHELKGMKKHACGCGWKSVLDVWGTGTCTCYRVPLTVYLCRCR